MLDWQNVLITPEEPIAKAIEILDKESPKIVLVVDPEQKLLGTITDGDIRRTLLHGHGLQDDARLAMHANPKVVSPGESMQAIKEKMELYRLQQMPMVDSDGVVQGLETLRHLNKQRLYDNPVFIMAGGFGKRLRPLTDDTPKPMLKVGSKPILERIIERFIVAGFHDFYISTHYKAKMVRDYFGDGSKWDVRIQYVHEQTPLGTAGALGLLPDDITDLPIIMMNGDLLTEMNYENLVQFHQDQGGIATICVKEYDIQLPYGVVKGEAGRVKKIEEKPIQRFFVNAGIYVLNKTLLNEVKGTEYIDMPGLLENLVEQGQKISMFPVHEYWIDIGQMEEFERAQKEAANIG